MAGLAGDGDRVDLLLVVLVGDFERGDLALLVVAGDGLRTRLDRVEDVVNLVTPLSGVGTERGGLRAGRSACTAVISSSSSPLSSASAGTENLGGAVTFALDAIRFDWNLVVRGRGEFGTDGIDDDEFDELEDEQELSGCSAASDGPTLCELCEAICGKYLRKVEDSVVLLDRYGREG